MPHPLTEHEWKKLEELIVSLPPDEQTQAEILVRHAKASATHYSKEKLREARDRWEQKAVAAERKLEELSAAIRGFPRRFVPVLHALLDRQEGKLAVEDVVDTLMWKSLTPTAAADLVRKLVQEQIEEAGKAPALQAPTRADDAPLEASEVVDHIAKAYGGLVAPWAGPTVRAACSGLVERFARQKVAETEQLANTLQRKLAALRGEINSLRALPPNQAFREMVQKAYDLLDPKAAGGSFAGPAREALERALAQPVNDSWNEAIRACNGVCNALQPGGFADANTSYEELPRIVARIAHVYAAVRNLRYALEVDKV